MKTVEELFSETELNLIRSIENVKFIYDEEYTDVDNCSYSENNIFVSKYSSKKIALIGIFHEIGHIKAIEKLKLSKIYNNCTLFSECTAWYEGMIVLKDCIDNFENVSIDLSEYNSELNKYIRKCLSSYHSGEYDELNRRIK